MTVSTDLGWEDGIGLALQCCDGLAERTLNDADARQCQIQTNLGNQLSHIGRFASDNGALMGARP